jgi:hypothetical protein
MEDSESNTESKDSTEVELNAQRKKSNKANQAMHALLAGSVVTSVAIIQAHTHYNEYAPTNVYALTNVHTIE